MKFKDLVQDLNEVLSERPSLGDIQISNQLSTLLIVYLESAIGLCFIKKGG